MTFFYIQHWPKQSINQQLNSRNPYHNSPSRKSYMVHIVIIWEKIEQIITSPHCIHIPISNVVLTLQKYLPTHVPLRYIYVRPRGAYIRSIWQKVDQIITSLHCTHISIANVVLHYKSLYLHTHCFATCTPASLHIRPASRGVYWEYLGKKWQNDNGTALYTYSHN